jgi:hypothetical protein
LRVGIECRRSVSVFLSALLIGIGDAPVSNLLTDCLAVSREVLKQFFNTGHGHFSIDSVSSLTVALPFDA